MRHLVIGCVLLVLAGCQQAGHVAPERRAAIKTVGVISTVGDQLGFLTIGITVFGNEWKQASLESWKLDDQVTAEVSGLLARRFEVRPVAAQRAKLAWENVCFPDSCGILDRRPPIAEALRAQVAAQGLDAYVLVSARHTEVRQSNQSVYGIGMVRRALGASLHVVYAITVFDGRDFKVIGEAWAAHPASRPADALVRGPATSADKTWWTGAPDADIRRPGLKLAVESLLRETLPPTVAALRLTE